MTSNVGAEILQRNTSLGFGSAVGTDDEDYESTKSKIIEESKKMFKLSFQSS